MPIILNPTFSSNFPAGYYTSTDRMGNMVGINVVTEMSNVQTSDDPNTLNIVILTDVLQRTDNWVNRRLREQDYQYPLSQNSEDFDIVSDFATHYACYLLYMSKPETITEDGSDPGGRMARHRDLAEEGLAALLTFGIDGAEQINISRGIDVVKVSDISVSANITQIKTV